MVLLGICVAAMILGFLRLATERQELPPGSSYSAQPDGALALYTWIEASGGHAQRVTVSSTDQSVATLLMLQPQTPFSTSTRRGLEAFAGRGGTIVLAGDSVEWVVAARGLGVTVEPTTFSASTATSPDGLRIPFAAHYRLKADSADPLLVLDDGDWVGLRMPYRQGALVVLASSDLLTNAGLNDAATARFVYRQIVGPLGAGTMAFDESGRPGSTTTADANTESQLLFGTAPGRAILYAALLTFAFLLLAGRRLGPPIVPIAAAASQRTMYEHVQMLADLYRRAGQVATARSAFTAHYTRLLARGGVNARSAPAYAEALARVAAARNESDLVNAVASVDDTR